MSSWPTWDEWLAALSEEERLRAVKLRDQFATLGADDPEGWARSEIAEGIAQLPRLVFLKGLWTRELLGWERPAWIDSALQYGEPGTKAAIERVRSAGVSDGDLVAIAKYIAGAVAFGVANYVDEGFNPDESELDDEEPLPGWQLLEVVTDPVSGQSRLSGRDVGGLHESLYDARPQPDA